MSIVQLLSKNIYYKGLYPFRRIWWFFTTPTRLSTRCIIEAPDGRVLMVLLRHGVKKWTFPGGALEKGETPEDAVLREVREEVGIVIANPTYIGDYIWKHHSRTFLFHCFHIKLLEVPNITLDPHEISDVRWVALYDEASIPQPVTSNLDKIRKLYSLMKTNES